MELFINIYHSLPSGFLPGLLMWAVAGGGVSILVELINVLFKIEGQNLARAEVTFFSFVGGVLTFITTTPGLNLLPAIGGYSVALLGIAHVWFWLATQPLGKAIKTDLADAAAFRQLSAPQKTSGTEQAPEEFAK
jgi:hypothetical protein